MTDIKEYRALFWESDGLYNSIMEKSGYSASEYMSIYCIANGVNTQAAIAKKLYMPKQTINSAIKKLSALGYVEACSRPGNNKEKHLSLTTLGQEVYLQKVAITGDIEEEVWQELGEKDRAALVSLTQKYNDILRRKANKYLSAKQD